jgi:imidazole glycerol-phosphate synthase subunit HisF
VLAKRIVPCLDVRHGEVVKGVRFEGLRAAGNAVALAERYVAEGADELVLLDVVATLEARAAFADVVRDVAKALSIPFTVGGGIRDVATARTLIEIGADKVSVNSAALRRPELITELSREFGEQAVVVAIDAEWIGDPKYWHVRSVSGTEATGRSALDWAKEAVDRGAGELLVTSITHDGVKQGFALDLIGALTSSLPVPIVASGGAGSIQHFVDVFETAGADAGLAASVFHYGEIAIPDLKRALKAAGIEVRDV